MTESHERGKAEQEADTLHLQHINRLSQERLSKRVQVHRKRLQKDP